MWPTNPKTWSFCAIAESRELEQAVAVPNRKSFLENLDSPQAFLQIFREHEMLFPARV